jgi:hypothetical protein
LVDPGVGTTDGYALKFTGQSGTDFLQVIRLDNGTENVIGANFSQELVGGDSMRIHAQGDTFTVYVDTGSGWTSLGTRTDSTYSAGGYVGLGAGGGATAGLMDNFTVEELAGDESISVADSGGGADAVSNLAAAVAIAETGAGGDTIPQALASAGVADTGSGAEAQAIQVSFLLPDTAAGSDIVDILTSILKSVADNGAGMDAIPQATVSAQVVDMGAGAGALAVEAALSVADTAAGLSSLVIAVLTALGEPGAGSDQITGLAVNVPLADTAAAVDLIAQVTAALSLADLGAGVDVATKIAAQKIAVFTFTFARRVLAFSDFAARSMSFDFAARSMSFDFDPA